MSRSDLTRANPFEKEKETIEHGSHQPSAGQESRSHPLTDINRTPAGRMESRRRRMEENPNRPTIADRQGVR
ncbi:hypothetical protein QYE76_045653 [Lolium multiflorum]|uniref:Uncharacterized protein n=1 Tax=Lolium multiflorum TaxID=4521 RepID=A0AAD8TLF7_LOLMU|nr:hypothetical protein QYE76_045653 [Lolium multiflorum]